MAENIAGLFEQFSRIIPIAGEAMTDFGESNALFAYAEGEEGCVTLTPETFGTSKSFFIFNIK